MRRPWHRRLDRVQAVLVLALCGLGLMTLYSASATAFHKQLLFVAIGLAVYAVAAAVDYRVLLRLARPAYVVCLLSLLAVMLLGHSRFGAQRWISVAGIPVQPSELAKLLVLVALAAHLGRGGPAGWRRSAVAGVVAAPAIVIVVLQPDLGTAIVFACLLVGLLFLAGAPRLLLAGVVTAVAVAVPLSPRLLHGYQRQRLEIFLDPARDPLGAGYNLIQARLAVGSGGLFGRGWLHGLQGQLGYVPERTNDFVFAVYAEQFGLVGGIVLLALFALLVWRLVRSAALARDRFGELMCGGLALIIAVQVIQNVGMNIGLTPIAGIPLPFISNGGSVTITLLAGLGVVQSVMLRRRAVLHQAAPGRSLLGEAGAGRLPVDPARARPGSSLRRVV